MIQEATKILSSGHDLNPAQMGSVMEEILQGKVQTPEIVSFLNALSKKGETAEELTAAVTVMRLHVTKVHSHMNVILDTCGTGGDARGTFNISTVAAFVAAGCGIYVAKHGNRSVSSKSGSADVLEALGININMPVNRIEECLEAIGIVFLFAQNLHPAMKYASEARKIIGRRTMFNILGPLSNPAAATHQLMGVYDLHWLTILAEVLRNLGSKHALVVHSKDGLDEISTTGPTYVAEAKDDQVFNYEIIPEDLGFKRATIEDLKGADVKTNTQILIDILKGASGPKRDIVVLNAAAAIYAADAAASIKEGVSLAEKSIDSHKALEKFMQLKDFSHKT